MKILFILAFIILSINVFAFTITGATKANVILKPEATEAEKYGANEFVKYIKAISDVDLKILETPGKGNNIFIGQSESAKKTCGISDWNSLDRDEIIIFAKGKNMVLAGGNGSGTIYAVYEFLDTYLGVKFITYDDEYIPKIKNIKVDNINIKYKSPFMSRESFFKQMNEHPDYCLKLKTNGHYNNVAPELGGHVELLGWAHTFDTYINKDKYGDEHPDWFAEKNGKRLNKEYSQLCISNQEMVKEMTKNVLETLSKHPDTRIISLTQNDNQSFCECENCKALTEKYGHSGALLTAINQVADAVKEKYPNTLVETFAYNYTRWAPKGNIVPRDNVIIRLCSIEADFGKTFDEPSNEDFYTNIENWSKITKNLYVWDYIVNFSNYVLLHPNFHVLQKNLQIMRDHNAVAVFEQGDSFNNNACFHNYKRYITAKLLWNPDLDMEKETIDFMKAYYGPAWKEMFLFLQYTNSVVSKTPEKVATYMYDNNYFSTEDWINLWTYLNNAENKVKNNPKFAERVKTDVLCMLGSVMSSKREIGQILLEKNLLPCTNFISGLDEMNAFLPYHGLTYYNEGGIWANGAYALSGNNKNKGTTPEICKNLKDEDWIDIQDIDLSPAGVIFDKEPYRKVVNDSTASDGKALKISPAFKDWYIQKKIGYLILDKTIKSADFYVVAKIEKGTKEGKAIECGVWSSVSSNVFTTRLGANDTPNNEWTTIKLGSVDFDKINAGAYLYFCGMNDENLSPNVLIDRVFIIINR